MSHKQLIHTVEQNQECCPMLNVSFSYLNSMWKLNNELNALVDIPLPLTISVDIARVVQISLDLSIFSVPAPKHFNKI